MLKIVPIIGSGLQTNCYILEEDNKAILIDFVPEVQGYIKKNNLKVDKILLTHIHYELVRLAYFE